MAAVAVQMQPSPHPHAMADLLVPSALSSPELPGLFQHRSSSTQSHARRSKLRTNKHALPPFSTPQHKLAQSLEAHDVSISPEPSCSSQHLPRLRAHRVCRSVSPSMLVGGHSQYSVASQRSWSPVRRLPLPPSLNFDTWWNEAGQRVGVVVSYNTATGVCTASLNVNVDARIMPRHGQTSVEPWDLHVGAKLRLLGRTLTLRKARDQETVTWLDQQARLLLHHISRLEVELSKFRVVMSPLAGLLPPTGVRYERLDSKLHGPVPCGGVINLRGLRERAQKLAHALRQHQHTLPPLPCVGGFAPPDGPQDWAPERALQAADASRKQAELQAKQAKEAAAAEEAYARRDLVDWLVGIPLAASAARLERRGNKYIDPVQAAVAARTAAQAKKAEAQAQRAQGNRRGSALMLDLDAFYKQAGLLPGGLPSMEGALKKEGSLRWLKSATSSGQDAAPPQEPQLANGVHLVHRPSIQGPGAAHAGAALLPGGLHVASGPRSAPLPATGAPWAQQDQQSPEEEQELGPSGSREYVKQPSVLFSHAEQLVLTPRSLARLTGGPEPAGGGTDDTSRRDQQEAPSTVFSSPWGRGLGGAEDAAAEGQRAAPAPSEGRLERHFSVSGRALLPTLAEEQDEGAGGEAEEEGAGAGVGEAAAEEDEVVEASEGTEAESESVA